jgi:hypothetical protein
MSIPDIAFIADSSGSMSSDLIAGDEEPYDLLLRAKYSVLNWIIRTGKAFHMKFGVINFSGSTYFSGWKPYSELDEVKKTLFHYQGGGTVLNPKVIERLYMERQDPFLAIVTTDGGLDNPEEAAEELVRLVEHGNDLAVVHIKSGYQGGCIARANEIFLGILEPHADIHEIEDAQDIIGIEIGYAQKYWGMAA